jgi:hypothetical protein
MKTKKFDKKLALNKKTISSLNNGQMKHAYGGAPSDVAYKQTEGPVVPPPIYTCYSCPNCHIDSACPETCLEC